MISCSILLNGKCRSHGMYLGNDARIKNPIEYTTIGLIACKSGGTVGNPSIVYTTHY